MKIAILENEPLHMKCLLELLQQWETRNSLPLDTDCFTSSEELLALQTWDYHLIFLDIELQGTNGIEAARALRKKNYRNELVFLTAYREYVFDGYPVHALDYILKPAAYDRLDRCLQYVKKKLRYTVFIYQYKNLYTKIPYSDILYFSSSNQYTEMITTSETYRQAGTLKNLLKTLPLPFTQCHRTLIVNISHVHKILGKTIYLSNGEMLPVSQTYLEPVRSAFLQQLSLNP